MNEQDTQDTPGTEPYGIAPHGHPAERTGEGVRVVDPWGTPLRPVHATGAA